MYLSAGHMIKSTKQLSEEHIKLRAVSLKHVVVTWVSQCGLN